jgi:hypothetical protein
VDHRVTLYFWDPKPVSTPEIHCALVEIEKLLLGLPRTSTTSDLPVGDNMAEISWTIEEPIFKAALKEVMLRVENYLAKELPHKPDKVDIAEDYVE